ncbi:hypothetical protein LDENG_00209910 [Lucifuga dentata]|nr:hypothetical protein LDENG_00209910 [Lucifuga dentata]
MARMNRPAPVEITYKNMRFLITHNPTNATLNKFIEELKKYGVTTVVRVCEATYDATLVVKEGIQVLDWPFDDGAPPSSQIVDDWLNLLKLKFREEPGCCVAVHCVAGLGRLEPHTPLLWRSYAFIHLYSTVKTSYSFLVSSIFTVLSHLLVSDLQTKFNIRQRYKMQFF